MHDVGRAPYDTQCPFGLLRGATVNSSLIPLPANPEHAFFVSCPTSSGAQGTPGLVIYKPQTQVMTTGHRIGAVLVHTVTVPIKKAPIGGGVSYGQKEWRLILDGVLQPHATI